MRHLSSKGLLLLAFVLATATLQAQEGRFKIGIGANYVTNNYDEAYLLDYGAISLNTSYALLQQPRFSVVWEQNILMRQKEHEGSRNTAFLASAPLTFRVQMRKTGIYAGMGPAYLSQKHEAYNIKQKVSGMQAMAVAGVAIRSRNFAEVFFTEYHIRASIHRSFSTNGYLTPQLSVLVQLGASQRAAR